MSVLGRLVRSLRGARLQRLSERWRRLAEFCWRRHHRAEDRLARLSCDFDEVAEDCSDYRGE